MNKEQLDNELVNSEQVDNELVNSEQVDNELVNNEQVDKLIVNCWCISMTYSQHQVDSVVLKL